MGLLNTISNTIDFILTTMPSKKTRNILCRTSRTGRTELLQLGGIARLAWRISIRRRDKFSRTQKENRRTVVESHWQKGTLLHYYIQPFFFIFQQIFHGFIEHGSLKFLKVKVDLQASIFVTENAIISIEKNKQNAILLYPTGPTHQNDCQSK